MPDLNDTLAAIPAAAERVRAWIDAHGGEIPSRARYMGDTADRSRVITQAWGPVLEAATGGAKAAPPVDAVPEGHRIRGVSTMVDASGAVLAQWVKTVEDGAAAGAGEVERLIRKLGTDPLPALPEIAPPRALDDDLLAVYPMGDPHVGMLAWARESGDSFDLRIAERLIVGAARDLVARGPRAARALIVNLGDYFHFDNADHHTTRGDHALDVDGRTTKILEIGVQILDTVVQAALATHREVELWNIAGNHDRHTSIMLAIALRNRYRDNPRVSVPIEPSARSYLEFGACLIGATHGDRAKPRDLGAIMATERPEAWGRTTHRTWLVGHVHHSTVQEVHGCTVETFRTLAARDSWHAGMGYSAGRDMRRITLHRQFGEVSRETASLAYLRAACNG